MEEDFIQMESSDFGIEESTPADQDMTQEVMEQDNQVEEVSEEPVQQEEPFLNVKYNKEERGLTREEAIELAQKGLNYDKVTERLNQAENNIGLKYLQGIANQHGTTVEDMVAHWQQQEYENEINTLVQNNIPEEYAREMVENQRFREQYMAQQEAEKQQQAQRAEYDDFFKSFPDVKPEEIPPEVWQTNENGIPLKYAFMEHKMNSLVNENKALKQKDTNRQATPVSGTSKYAGNDHATVDPFMAGFNSI